MANRYPDQIAREAVHARLDERLNDAIETIAKARGIARPDKLRIPFDPKRERLFLSAVSPDAIADADLTQLPALSLSVASLESAAPNGMVRFSGTVQVDIDLAWTFSASATPARAEDYADAYRGALLDALGLDWYADGVAWNGRYTLETPPLSQRGDNWLQSLRCRLPLIVDL